MMVRPTGGFPRGPRNIVPSLNKKHIWQSQLQPETTSLGDFPWDQDIWRSAVSSLKPQIFLEESMMAWDQDLGRAGELDQESSTLPTLREYGNQLQGCCVLDL